MTRREAPTPREVSAGGVPLRHRLGLTCGDAGALLPEVVLLDARKLHVDRAGLRAAARGMCAASGAAFSSRSYRFPYALVGTFDAPLGVDIEAVARCDRAFAECICTPDERADPAVFEGGDAVISSLWCAKEALAKVLGDPLTYDPARLEAPLRWEGGRCGGFRAVELTPAPGHVAWVCWRAGAEPLPGGPARRDGEKAAGLDSGEEPARPLPHRRQEAGPIGR